VGASKRGVRGTLDRLGGALVLIIALGGLAWIGSLFSNADYNRLISLSLQLLLAVPVWVLFIRLMLSRRRSAREVLPSAIVSSIGQILGSWGTQVYVPHLIQVDAQRYSVIGVAFALVSGSLSWRTCSLEVPSSGRSWAPGSSTATPSIAIRHLFRAIRARMVRSAVADVCAGKARQETGIILDG
jgi:hypothetical protein